MSTTLYQLNGEWVTLERFRKAKGIDNKEKEVIEIKEEAKIVEPELKVKSKKYATNKKGN